MFLCVVLTRYVAFIHFVVFCLNIAFGYCKYINVLAGYQLSWPDSGYLQY
jgi:hypothetical protein